MSASLPQTIDPLVRAAFDRLQLGHHAAAVEVHEATEDGLADARWDFDWHFDQDVVVQARYRTATGHIAEQLLPFAVLLERALEVEVLDVHAPSYEGLSWAAAARVHHQDPLPAGLVLPRGTGLHAVVGWVSDYSHVSAMIYSRQPTVPGFQGATTVGAALAAALQRTEIDGRKQRFREAQQRLGFSPGARGETADEQTLAAAALHAYLAAPNTADGGEPALRAVIIDQPARGQHRTVFQRSSPQPGDQRRRGLLNEWLLTDFEQEAFGGRRGDERTEPLSDATPASADDEWTARIEDHVVFQQALSALEGRDAEIVRRVYVLHQSQAAVAEAFGVSQPAIAQALERIIGRLRKRLAL
jgi:RNA polymerase sigma factor (sigma-70 family)